MAPPNQRPEIDHGMKAAGKGSYFKSGAGDGSPSTEDMLSTGSNTPTISDKAVKKQQQISYNGGNEPSRPTYNQHSSNEPGSYAVRRMQLTEYDEERRQAAPSQDPGFCVDELCSCGMHKCTPSRKPLPFQSDSLYRSEFGAKPLQPPVPVSEVKLPPPLPFVGKSSYRADFISKALPPPTQTQEVKLPPPLPFTGDSSYRTTFTPKSLPPPTATSEVKLPPPLPFEASSSYRSDFVQKPLAPPSAVTEVKLPAPLPFEGTSNYRSEFLAKPLPPPVVHQEMKLSPPLPFDGNTLYRRDFQKKEMPICQVSLMPPYPAAPYPSNHVFWDKQLHKWY